MQGLIVGRMVHYIQQLPDQVGTAEYAAVVTRVHDEHHPEDYPEGSIEAACDRHEDGDVTLHVFMENSVVVYHNVPYRADHAPNSWHWIERDDEPVALREKLNTAIELKPGHKYLLAFKGDVTQRDLETLSKHLLALGIENIGLVLHDLDMQVIEAPAVTEPGDVQ